MVCFGNVIRHHFGRIDIKAFMKFLKFLFLPIFVAASVCGISAQEIGAAASKAATLVYGRPFTVPEVRVYLTDEETGGPFAEKDVAAKYCWGWDVLKRTPESDRIANTQCISVKRRTDAAGVVSLPTLLISPSRPIAPPGSEFSQPRFKYAGLTVHDDKHDTYMSVFDAEVNLLDEKGEVRRTVMLYPRPKTPKE